MRLIGSTNSGDLIVEMTPKQWQDVQAAYQTSIQGQTAVLPPLVTHINQNAEGSKQFLNDCGMACAAMAIHAMTDKRPTVDHLMMHYISQEKRNKYLTFNDLSVVLKSFGLKPDYKRPFLTDSIKTMVEAGWPCMVLVKYSALPKRLQARDFDGSHFVLISDYANDAFRMHDPLVSTAQWINGVDLHTAMSGFKAGENMPYQGMVIRK